MLLPLQGALLLSHHNTQGVALGCELIGLSARPHIRQASLFNYIHNMMIVKEISYLSSFLADNNKKW